MICSSVNLDRFILSVLRWADSSYSWRSFRGSRQPAHVRIAATLTNLFDRLSERGDAPGGMFHMPLTQRDLGDLIGITPVHVNRTLREMDRLNLIKRSDQTISLLDVDRLRRIAGLPVRNYVSGRDWIASV
ncbi:helix-turn-helix domain-containing protein [Brevundimonas sp. BT-123]|uniref:Crp/Fnr family transcriptional regulator n=1 Tax=Brevundimonas sp. BT-123 TaxID=2986928 RepID=UPI00223675DE|nr:helix-turn-helix domain-containing protein [Brevundimonas sp. BT-123]MCW0045940.1 helix-turn-helix domain-containing protein [Brevundimonas sp. BT-123]